MKAPGRAFLGLAVAAMASVGCAMYPGTARPAYIDDLRAEKGWVLLDTVPYVRQVSEKGCGAACLAMVLGHWGSGSPVESIEKECSGGGKDGIRAAAMRDAAKRRGLSAYLFQGSAADLEHELSKGRPVIVGVLKPFRDGFTSHFEVVIGIHLEGRRIAMLDPAIGLMCDSLEGFENEWRPTKGVTLVVFRPEAMVASAPSKESGNGGGP